MSVRRAGVIGAGGCNPPRVINTAIYPALHGAQLADSPLGLWPLQETSGATAFDASGNGHNGTYAGGTQGQAAIGGNGDVSYAGIVTVPHASWMDVNSYTYEILVYPLTSVAGSPMGRYTSGTGVRWLPTTTGATNYLYAADGTDYGPNGSTGIAINTPYLLAIRWDQGAGTCSSANNGVVTASVSNGNRAASNPAVPINLGDCRDAGGPWYQFSGRIAYAAYYGSALSDARLLAHAQAAGLA